MALINEIAELEKRLAEERNEEFTKKCQRIAQSIKQGATDLLEDAIKYKKYRVNTTGFFRKKTTKSVYGHTCPIHIDEGYSWPTPHYSYSDGDEWYTVRNMEEYRILMGGIRTALENEGFMCGVDEVLNPVRGFVLYYKMEWE